MITAVIYHIYSNKFMHPYFQTRNFRKNSTLYFYFPILATNSQFNRCKYKQLIMQFVISHTASPQFICNWLQNTRVKVSKAAYTSVYVHSALCLLAGSQTLTGREEKRKRIRDTQNRIDTTVSSNHRLSEASTCAMDVITIRDCRITFIHACWKLGTLPCT